MWCPPARRAARPVSYGTRGLITEASFEQKKAALISDKRGSGG